MSLTVTSTNIQRRNNTNVKQIHPRVEKRERTLPNSFRRPRETEPKPSQGYYRKGKLQTNFFQSHECNDLKANPRKSDPATYK